MLTEDLNHEFKIQYTKDIIKTVIVVGNTSGGKIYIGVVDAGNGIGINNPDEELRSLNQNLTFEVLTKEFRKSDIQIDQPQMRTLGIIGDDGLFTNLDLLLSDQCHHSIKAAVFEGTTKSQFKDRYEFDGSVMRQMREALLNSIVHKDYGYGSSTLISVFDDRIEILTVGGLVKGLTKDDIMIGTSILRNKKLANVFYRLKWIEAYGTGILKIKESYRGVETQPLIEITDNAFKVTLPAITELENKNIIEHSFNASVIKIIEMIDRLGQVKRIDVQNVLEISQPMAVKLLKGLLEKQAIIRIGSGKNVVYKKK